MKTKIDKKEMEKTDKKRRKIKKRKKKFGNTHIWRKAMTLRNREMNKQGHK